MITNGTRRQQEQGGWTVVELVVAGTVVAIAFLLALVVLRRQAEDLGATTAATDMGTTARRVLGDLVREVGDSGPARVVSHPDGADTMGAQSIRFAKRVALGSADPADDWSGEIVYELVASPGEIIDARDNDGDGVTDERRIERRAPGEPTTIVADGVLALSFGRGAADGFIDVVVEVARRGPNGRDPFRERAGSRVFLRNRE